MEKHDYDKMMAAQIAACGGKKKLLLHCCCAPCASSCLERLKDHFDITVFFYNPNIAAGEYERRKNELLRLIGIIGGIGFLNCGHAEEEFLRAAAGLENCPEGGARCEKCFALRLKKTAEAANEGGFDYFTTTLTLSPLKNAEKINRIGESLGGAKWLFCDFKKRDGYKRSVELSKLYGLYRQNYCGCVFSLRDRQTLENPPRG